VCTCLLFLLLFLNHSLLFQTPAAPVLQRESKKRKEPEDYTSATPTSNAGPSIKRGKKDKPPEERKSKNTAVYVTNLPTDTELDEIAQTFSRYGVLEEDDEGEPKIKMYAKEDGSFSGEALVVYFKEESVTLALNLLDESELRLGDPSSVMSVKMADFSHKQTGGEGQSQPRKTVDRKKATRRITKMQKCVVDHVPLITQHLSIHLHQETGRLGRRRWIWSFY